MPRGATAVSDLEGMPAGGVAGGDGGGGGGASAAFFESKEPTLS